MNRIVMEHLKTSTVNGLATCSTFRFHIPAKTSINREFPGTKIIRTDIRLAEHNPSE